MWVVVAALCAVLAAPVSVPTVLAGVSKPGLPGSFALSPIVAGAAGSTTGYLPGSGSVTSTGAYTYTVPLDVPAGRAGMKPALALVYSSSGANGVLGQGWSLSGVSSIARCGQTLSTNQVSGGVHYTDYAATPSAQRDRFCLDGQQLIQINPTAVGYGQDGAVYRTEQDGNADIVSHALAGAAGAQGPYSFTVDSPDGAVQTYDAVSTLRASATASGISPAGTVDTVWVLASVQDASGNGMQFVYNVSSPSDSCPAETGALGSGQVLQVLLCSITYTTYQGSATGAYRRVSFAYGRRPDQMVSWQGGVESQLMERMTSVTMSAPDPAASVPVWRYVIGYQSSPSSFSGRSLLTSVQKCAMASAPLGVSLRDCTLAKQFGYTQGSATPSFVAASVPGQTNVAIDDTMISAGGSPGQQQVQQAVDGEAPPMLKVFDTTNSGHDDLLVQDGSTETWLNELATWEGAPCNGDNLGKTDPTSPVPCDLPFNYAPKLLLGTQVRQSSTTGTATSPLGASGAVYDLSGDRTFFPMNSEYYTANLTGGVASFHTDPYYPNGRLENLAPVDPDGTGAQSLLMTDVNHGLCGRLLDWQQGTSPGFTDRGVNYAGCTGPIPGLDNPTYLQAQPSGDFDGDGRQDVLTTLPEQGADYALDPYVNLGGNQTVEGGSTYAGSGIAAISAKCPYYLGDFTGDGRAEILGQSFDPNAQGVSTPTGAPDGSCGSTSLYSYTPSAPGKGSFSMAADTAGALPDLQQGTPFAGPGFVQPDGTSCKSWNPQQCPMAGYDSSSLYFGNFTGDGLQDVIIADNQHQMLSLRQNTGNGYGPPISLGSPSWMAGAYAIQVADINRTGRDSLVVFHEQPSRAITMMLNNGTVSSNMFTSVDVTATNASSPADPGLRTYEGRTNSVLGDFNGQGEVGIATLVGDPNHTVAKNGGTYTNQATLETLTQPTYQATMPAGGAYTQPAPDLLATVTDQGANFTDTSVSYTSATAPASAPSWSDKPTSALVCQAMQYPRRCATGDLVVVRSVTSQDATATNAVAHTVDYSYELPVLDARGRGFLGFGEVRAWDPTRLQQTITMYDNTTESGTELPAQGSSVPYGADSYIPTLYGPGYYAGASGRPESVTTITIIPPDDSQSLPTLSRDRPVVTGANARVDQTVYNTHLVQTNNGTTFVIEPDAGSSSPAQVTSQWETSASTALSVTASADPTSDNIWGNWSTYPITPPSSAVSTTTTVGQTCDSTGANPGSGTGACIDAFGNVTDQKVQSSTGTGSSRSSGATTETVSTFDNLTGAPWKIGLPSSVTVTDTEPDPADPVVSRRTAYDYDADGRLQDTYACQQTSSPPSGSGACGSFALVSTETLGYDQYGNVITDATSATGPDGKQDVRQVDTEYDPMFPNEPDERIFPSQSWVPADYPGTTSAPSTWQAVQPAYGVVEATMDVNGVFTQYTYDDQGRILSSTPGGALASPPSGTATTYSYADRTDPVLGGSDGMIVTAATGGAQTITVTDSAGRIILTKTTGFDGTLEDTSTTYDTLGRTVATSRPYPDGASAAYQATAVYDGLDRRISTTTPDGHTTKYGWNFFTILQSDAKGISHTVVQAQTISPAGELSVVDTDMDGNTIASGTYLYGTANPGPWQLETFHYQAFGLQDVAQSPNGVQDTTSYNTLGQVTGTSSPDTGATAGYTYDGFGELLTKAHQPNGSSAPDATTSYTYDPILGRELGWKTTDTSGGTPAVTSASFTYDTAPNGLGKLAAAASSDNVAYAYAYDSQGRPSTTTETVGGSSYTLTQTYDSQGRPATLDYPATAASGSQPAAAITDTYNTANYLQNITYTAYNPLTNQQVGSDLWQITSRYPDGTLESAAPSNAATDNIGVAVTYQQNPATGQLTNITAIPGANYGQGKSNAPALNLSYGYDPDGRVSSKTDTVNGRTETYGYDPANRLTSWTLSTCSTPGCTAAPTDPDTRTTSYGYDPDGNLDTVQLSPTLGASATTTQTFQYGTTNTGTGQAGPHGATSQTSTANSTYTYDSQGRQTAAGGRALTYNACNLPTKITTNAGTWTMSYGPYCDLATRTGPYGTTVYIDGVYQQRTGRGGTVTRAFLVPGVGQIQTVGKSAPSIEYTVTDPQSTTSLVVDGYDGQVDPTDGTQFYDPFGTQINADGTTYTGSQGTVTQGFTGQEQNPDTGLDNDNGRQYDPAQDHFTTPDPLIGNPLNPQAYNPYAYVDDNPANNTDPTGYEPCTSPDDGCGAGETAGDGPQNGDQVQDENGLVWTYLSSNGAWNASYYAGGGDCGASPADGCTADEMVCLARETMPTPFSGYDKPDTTPAPGPTAESQGYGNGGAGGAPTQMLADTRVPNGVTAEGLEAGAQLLKIEAGVAGGAVCALIPYCSVAVGVGGLASLSSHDEPDAPGKIIGGVSAIASLPLPTWSAPPAVAPSSYAPNPNASSPFGYTNNGVSTVNYASGNDFEWRAKQTADLALQPASRNVIPGTVVGAAHGSAGALAPGVDVPTFVSGMQAGMASNAAQGVTTTRAVLCVCEAGQGRLGSIVASELGVPTTTFETVVIGGGNVGIQGFNGVLSTGMDPNIGRRVWLPVIQP